MYQICEFLKNQQTSTDKLTVLQTIQNSDGTVSVLQQQVDNSHGNHGNNSTIITLPDGTQAQVQGVATVSIYIFFFIKKISMATKRKKNEFFY
jgi:hypothetical protein